MKKHVARPKALTGTDANFNQLLLVSVPVVVIFGKRDIVTGVIKASLHNTINKFLDKALFVDINMTTAPIITAKYNVTKAPTTLIFKHGKVVNTFVGFVSRQTIEKNIAG